MRASLREAAEDREQAAQAGERYHRETLEALRGAAQVGRLIRQDIRGLTQTIREQTHSIGKLVRALTASRNGHGGNGRRRL